MAFDCHLFIYFFITFLELLLFLKYTAVTLLPTAAILTTVYYLYWLPVGALVSPSSQTVFYQKHQ